MSVLCIINKLNFEQIERIAATAQEKALQFGVPVALVYCVSEQNELLEKQRRLVRIEAVYAAYNIPLLTVIGGYDSAISTLKHHFQPVIIFDASLRPESVHHSLQPHPHEWPGRVIGVNELAGMQGIACRL